MKIVFSSVQWFAFMMASVIIAPLSVGVAFQLDVEQMASLLQRSFFVIGLTSILQVLFGHKLPIIEGPAGVWWGVFLIYASVAVEIGDSTVIWQQLMMGLIISGCIFIFLGAFNQLNRLITIFTPLVTATYLLLLIGQLSGPFLKGMLGIGYFDTSVNAKVALTSMTILTMSILFSKSRWTWVGRYSILWSLMLGWALFYILGLTKPLAITNQGISIFPEVLPFGLPQFNLGMLITVIISTLLLLTNMLASIEAMNVVMNEKNKPVRYRQSSIVMGINQMIAAIFSSMGNVPISGSAGFILTTKMKRKLPFIIGSLIMLSISFIPSLMIILASIPAPVGYATIFIAMANMGALGISELVKSQPSFQQLVIVGISLMVGLGVNYIPNEAVSHLPMSIRTIANNGLIIGVITCILLQKKTTIKEKSVES